MKGRLTDKIIIITGGSGLLGKSIVSRLQQEGAQTINFDVKAIETLDLSLMNVDITDERSVENAIIQVLEKFGRIDGLVNNAYPRTEDWGMKFEDIRMESWRQNIDLQLNSYFLMTQRVAKIMAAQKFGSIVNMASIYGVVGPNFSIYDNTNMTMPAAYSAIKGGLVNFTRYVAAYYGKQQVRVNLVSPGGIFDNQAESFVKKYNEIVPLARMGDPDDISPSVAFLLSDDSKYITGQNLIVDGGWTAI